MCASFDLDQVAGAGGLSFCIVRGTGPAGLIAAAKASVPARDISAWVRIAPDGAITPLGGLAFIVGWVALGLAFHGTDKAAS